MGGRVEARAKALGARDRLDHRADAAFAVGPGDVDAGERRLGVAEAGARGAHRVEPHPHSERDAGVELRERRSQIGHGDRRYSSAEAAEGAGRVKWPRMVEISRFMSARA